jgi:dTDP-4-amino-4,6-dideoxygalactose transaminase
LFGLAADMDAVLTLATRAGLIIIEDAACGFAARYEGAHVGLLGAVGCFSFHPRKAITTGEGGMVTTRDDQLASKLRSMRDHGASVSDHQRHYGARPYLLPEFPFLGFNYRMTDIQASIGSTQMDRAHEIADARRRWAARYDELMTGISWLRPQVRAEECTHGYQAYVCLFEPDEVSVENVFAVNNRRNAFMDFLQKNGVSTRPGTHAIHLLEYYVRKYGYQPEQYPGAFIADRCSIAFPLFPSMSDDEFTHISSLIKSYRI